MKVPTISPRTYISVALCFVLCVGLLYASWRHKEAWSERQYFGEVRLVTKNRIVISDPEVPERSFYTEEDTEFVYGGEVGRRPELGGLAQIVLKTDMYGKDKVWLVRRFDREVLADVIIIPK